MTKVDKTLAETVKPKKVRRVRAGTGTAKDTAKTTAPKGTAPAQSPPLKGVPATGPVYGLQARVAPPPKKVLPELTLGHLLSYGLPDALAVPLYRAVTTMRAGESVAEGNFVAWLINYCSPYAELRMVDAAGNVHFVIPTLHGGASESLFVAHTDTVHHSGGKNKVGIENGMIHGVDQPLGADDGAGVAILCYMMANRVPGRYIFTRQEESGGIGAGFIAEHQTGILSKFKRAIAFDRRGTGEVIVVQGGSRCASDKFGDALSDALNEHGLLYMTSDKGVYTDTKEFRYDVPECVNISTGYYQEHGSSEHQDLGHLTMLALAAVKIDWESLPTERDPKAKDDYDFDDSFFTFGGLGLSNKKSGRASTAPSTTPTMSRFERLGHQGISLLEEAVYDWYWGKKFPLSDMLAQKLAKDNAVPLEEARVQISIEKLKESQVDMINLEDEEFALEAMLKIVTV